MSRRAPPAPAQRGGALGGVLSHDRGRGVESAILGIHRRRSSPVNALVAR